MNELLTRYIERQDRKRSELHKAIGSGFLTYFGEYRAAKQLNFVNYSLRRARELRGDNTPKDPVDLSIARRELHFTQYQTR